MFYYTKLYLTMIGNELKMKGILSHWNIGSAKLVKYRMNIIKITSQGSTFYLKERKGTSHWERMEEYRITQYLNKKGFNVETPLLNNHGEPYVEEEGCYFSLYASLEGTPLKGGEEYSREQLFRLGEYLSRFHFELNQYPFEKNTHVWDVYKYVKSWIFQSSPELSEWAVKVHGEISSYEVIYRQLPLQLVHSDAHLRNVLWRGDEILGLVDFERIRLSPRIADLAYMITSLLRNSGLTIGSHQFRSLIRELIKGYTANQGLTDGEGALLPGVIILFLLQYTLYYSQQGCVKAAVYHKKSIDYLIGDKDYLEKLITHDMT
jgi:Ser/Thr protein kinase RdoA (MazF antagonist)